MTVRALNDRLIVRQVPAEPERSAGGLFIPETARKFRSYVADVVSVGPDGQLGLKPGDRIVYFKDAGWDLLRHKDGEPHLMMLEQEDVLAVFE